MHAAVTSAVLHWNEGASSQEVMMAAMNIPAGVHTVLGSDKKNTNRLHSSFRTSSELVKRQRKATKLENLTTESSRRYLIASTEIHCGSFYSTTGYRINLYL